jgi:hypothetical protein
MAQNGAGFLSRTVDLSTVRPFIKYLGVVSDEDNTALLQASLDASEFIELPPGTFYFSTLNIPSGSVVRGAGTTTTLVQTGAGIGFNLNMVQDVHLENLILKANTATATMAISLQNSQHIYMRNVRIDGFPDYRWSAGGLILKNPEEEEISCWDVVLEHSQIRYCGGSGIHITGLNTLTARNCLIEANAGYGIYAPHFSRFSLGLYDSTLQGNGAGQLYADELFDSVICRNGFENAPQQRVPLLSLGLGGACRGLAIVGNAIGGGTPDYCIDIGGMVAVTIYSNLFSSALVAACRLKNVWNSYIGANEITLDAFDLATWAENPQSQVVFIQDKTGARLVSSSVYPAPIWYVGIEP